MPVGPEQKTTVLLVDCVYFIKKFVYEVAPPDSRTSCSHSASVLSNCTLGAYGYIRETLHLCIRACCQVVGRRHLFRGKIPTRTAPRFVFQSAKRTVLVFAICVSRQNCLAPSFCPSRFVFRGAVRDRILRSELRIAATKNSAGFAGRSRPNFYR